MTKKGMVSFVILNFNSSLLVRKCVASIQQFMTAGSYETIVVDNGSRPEELALLDGMEGQGCHIVRMNVNTGFDTSIFLYYEEYDLAKRLDMHGRKRMVHPQYTFLHVHDASTSAIRTLALRENYVSKIYTYKKYHGALTSLLFQAILTAKLIFKPQKWHILAIVTSRHVLSHSMRHRQHA